MDNCLKNYMTHIRESILDPIKDKLSSDLWDKNRKILPKVKKQIISVFEDWSKKIDLNIKYTGMKITGSMAGYQYNDYSDIDINVEIDIPEERFKRIRKLLPNGNKLDGTDHPVNYYLSADESNKGIQQFIYDLIEEKWIKDPDKVKVKNSEQVRILYKSALDQAISWMRKISLDIDEMNRLVMELKMCEHFLADEGYHADEEDIQKHIDMKKNAIKSGYDTLNIDLHMLKNFRNEAYIKGGEFDSKVFPEKMDHPDYSLNNIMLKILEKFGYLDIIYQTKEEYKKKFPELLGE